MMRVSAYAVCRDERNRLLLCRIAPGATDRYDGWWTLPGGGIEHGEDPRDAALRELTEETGLVGELTDLIEVDSLHTTITDRDGTDIDYHGIRLLYACTVVGGTLRDEVGGSTDACRWFDARHIARVRIVDIARLAVTRIGVA